MLFVALGILTAWSVAGFALTLYFAYRTYRVSRAIERMLREVSS